MRVSRPDSPDTAGPAALSDEQTAVLECLQKSGTGLTGRQLASRVSCDPGALEQALSVLMERGMVARLNTIIPSYSYRHPGARIHAE